MLGRIGLVIVILAVVAVTTPASPVQVSYVYSDSMEPTIEQNDGYVVVPAGTVDDREIVVFWSPERDEYVTHRVVGHTSAGFLTKGDNNDVTDQDAGYPHVQRRQIVGRVLTINGDPVTLPALGTLLSFVGEYRLVVYGIAGVVVGGSLLRSLGTPSARPERSVVRVDDVMYPLFAIVFIGSIGALLLGASSHELTYVAVDGAAGGANTLSVGDAKTGTVFIHVRAFPFTHRVVSTEGMTIMNRSANASTITAHVNIPAATETGAYSTSVTVYRYPAILPEPVLRTLHTVHPLVPAGATVGLLFVPLLVLYGMFLDGYKPLRASRSRWQRRLGGKNG